MRDFEPHNYEFCLFIWAIYFSITTFFSVVIVGTSFSSPSETAEITSPTTLSSPHFKK